MIDTQEAMFYVEDDFYVVLNGDNDLLKFIHVDDNGSMVTSVISLQEAKNLRDFLNDHISDWTS